MSSTSIPTTASRESVGLPVAAIVCIAVGGYVVLIVIILTVKSILQSHGMCNQTCDCCGKENESCCHCCVVLNDMCTCVKSPNMSACLDSLCPSRKGLMTKRCAGCGIWIQTCCDNCTKLGAAEGPDCRMDCADLLTCQCCADPNNQCCTCCNSQEPLCDCGQCNCNCACTPPDCQDVNCFCFKIQSKAIPAAEDEY